MAKELEKVEKAMLAVEMIIDNSGSMQCIKGKVVKGVNKFIEELASAIFPVRLGVTLFDDILRTSLIDGISVSDAPRVKEDDYNPNWGTENIAHCVIQALDKRLAPVDALHKVLVVVTDGLNRSSDMDRAKALVAKRQSEGWLIIWFGVFIEEYEGRGHGYKKMLLDYAKGLGIPEGVTFALGSKKIDKAVPLAASATFRFMGSGCDVEAAGFTKAERELA